MRQLAAKVVQPRTVRTTSQEQLRALLGDSLAGAALRQAMALVTQVCQEGVTRTRSEMAESPLVPVPTIAAARASQAVQAGQAGQVVVSNASRVTGRKGGTDDILGRKNIFSDKDTQLRAHRVLDVYLAHKHKSPSTFTSSARKAWYATILPMGRCLHQCHKGSTATFISVHTNFTSKSKHRCEQCC